MTRACIFCGSQATLTGEHVFPDWMNGLFPSQQVGDTTVLRRLVHSEHGVRDHLYTKKDVATQTTRFVCGECNNGWMSALERQAQPLITALAGGDRRTLSLTDQLLLAGWAIKTFQVCDTTWGQQLLSSQDDRAVVMRECRPPAHVRVWALAYQGQVGPLRATHLVLEVREADGPTLGRTYLATLQIGCLVLQIGGADPGIATGAGLESLGAVTPRRIQLFPPTQPMMWPPREILNDETFIAATTESSVIDTRIPTVQVPSLHDLTRPPHSDY